MIEDLKVDKPIKLMFMDEMRFGLISNYRRSWSKIGKRTVIANQQEYANRYLYSAIDPITGDNFHLIGFNDVNASITKKFLDALCEKYPDNHIVMIWDNAPFHRKKELHQIHFQAWKKGLKSLYYCRSKSIQRAENINRGLSTGAAITKTKEDQDNEECLSCQ